jgi:hypothetical protein
MGEDFLTDPVTTGHHPTGSCLAIRANLSPIYCLFYYQMVYLYPQKKIWYIYNIY